MTETKLFLLDMVNDETKEDVSELKEILEKIGMTLSIQKSEDGERDFLMFNYDPENVLAKFSRNAGRKQAMTEGYLTFEDIKNMQKEMNNEEIIKKIGISKATFYRRLKECKSQIEQYGFNYDDIPF